jgi:peptide/nickel transport system permease protein
MDTKDQNTGVPGTLFSNPAEGLLQTEFQNVPSEEKVPESTQLQAKSRTPLQDSLRHFRHDTRAMVCLGILTFIVLVAIFGPMIYVHIGGTFNSPDNGPVGPSVYHTFYHQELSMQDQGPSAMYWLGTDSIGRDLLARLMQGLRASLMVAILVEIITDVIGITVGILAGFYGGWIDQFLARFTDIMFAFPGLLFTILVAGIFGSVADSFFSHVPLIGSDGDARLVLVAITLAIVSWPGLARLVRGQTLQLKEQQYIEAARTSGSNDLRILLSHILPNLLGIIIVTISFDIPTTITAEAGLSFLGLGVQQPGSSIGLMISDATNLLDTHPWEVLLPSIVLTILVVVLSFIGDGLRDAFDPRSKS